MLISRWRSPPGSSRTTNSRTRSPSLTPATLLIRIRTNPTSVIAVMATSRGRDLPPPPFLLGNHVSARRREPADATERPQRRASASAARLAPGTGHITRPNKPISRPLTSHEYRVFPTDGYGNLMALARALPQGSWY